MFITTADVRRQLRVTPYEFQNFREHFGIRADAFVCGYHRDGLLWNPDRVDEFQQLIEPWNRRGSFRNRRNLRDPRR